jgi:hypothetical protein
MMSLVRVPGSSYRLTEALRVEYELAHTKARETIPATFWNWLDENPTLWRTFLELALQAFNVRERYSARTVIEVMRWNTDILEAGGSFKIGNNHVPHMARLFNHLVRREFFSLRDNGGKV